MTLRQERFAKEYVKNGGNIQQAALAAGYSKTSAAVTGTKMLKNAKVLARRRRRYIKRNKIAVFQKKCIKRVALFCVL